MSTRHDVGQGFAFISISKPDEVKSKVTQKKIRHHVMSQVGKARRKRPRFLTIAVDIPPAAIAKASTTKGSDAQPTVYQPDNLTVPEALFPYGLFAVAPTPRARQLIHFSMQPR